jgi:hexosaminidase
VLMRLSWPGMAYGAVAAWQSEPVANGSFFAGYARQMYPPSIAGDVTSALVALNASELHLQHALGQNSMMELWRNPFAPARLASSRQHQDDLRQSRLLAEEAQEALARIPSAGDTSGTLDDLVFAARLLDYAGLKFLYSVEIDAAWSALGPHPSRDRLNEFIDNVSAEQHGRLPDLIDAITALRPHYQRAWLAEYQPYRMATALGRWDAEYQAWQQMQAHLGRYPESYQADSNLPPLESILGAWY